MLTEDYCNFDIAKLLAEKGFDYYPDGSYWLIDANNVMYWVSEIGAYDYVDNPTESFQRPKNGYRLVTQAMAMKWLREVHNKSIEIRSQGLKATGIGWVVEIYNLISQDEEYHHPYTFPTYEDACEAAIKYSLENLI